MFSDDYAPGCYWMRDAPLPAAPVEHKDRAAILEQEGGA